ncbi:MAG TPA: ISAzo13 family transposase [Anaerolineales bacterium]|nr:ISAzo13 family transposase [Anaerolineales bacterium]
MTSTYTESSAVKNKLEVLRPFMNERLRRLWAGTEANAIGHGGITLVSKATGLSCACIRTGIHEIRQLANLSSSGNSVSTDVQSNVIRQPGAGRKLVEDKDPSIIFALEQMLENESAGDPMSEQKWIRSSTHELSRRLGDQGYKASPETVRRLLYKMDFSLKANKRRQIHTNYPGRDDQFRFIASQREAFSIAELPIISVDTKKKELIGEFNNNGRAWSRQAEEVNEHDFPSTALCKAVPYGIYDVVKNSGFVVVGISSDTPEFAVDNIVRWWKIEGQHGYPHANKLLILADSGGSNSYRSRSWKLGLQEKLSDQFGLAVTVCHYPPGCSKWKPVEHRLFSYISINWAGKPLKTINTMLAYICGTKTTKGLTVKAFLQEQRYQEGKEVPKEMMKQLDIHFLVPNPQWNYTISPR